MDKLIKLIRKNGMMEPDQLAVMLGEDVEVVKEKLQKFQDEGIIKGFKAVIDYPESEGGYVEAIIELRVAPQRDTGFDSVAEQIAGMKEVDSLFLMSGGYDLFVKVYGKTFQDIAMMVAKKLSTIPGVTGTKTHFMLKKYKEDGMTFIEEKADLRGVL